MSKMNNYLFTIYHIYHKKKLEKTKSTYNFCPFYKFDLLKIMEMQTNDMLILINIIFTNNKKKLMIKDYE